MCKCVQRTTLHRKLKLLIILFEMKRFFTLVLLALVVVSCGKGHGELPADWYDYELEVTSDANVWFDGEGGYGDITYTIEGETPDLKLNVECDTDWITIVEIGGDSVTYFVDDNDDNVERRGVITLRYGSDEARVVVMQRTKIDVVYQATTISGSEYYYVEDGVYNYYVVLSTEGVDEEGYLFADTQYYYFDLYSATPAEGSMATIPEGTYRLTWDGELADGVIGHEYSSLTLTAGGVIEEVGYKDAELTVANGTIVANVTLATGERVRVEYSGSLEIPVYTGVITEGLSTLVEDHFFDIQDGVFVGAYVGEYYYFGCNTCQVYMFEYLDYETGEERGDQFQIDLQLPLGGTDICGTYTEGSDVGYFIPGSAVDMDGQFMQQNSWYMTAGFVDFAPLVSGKVVVEKDDTDLYTFTIDTVDDMGNVIKGVFRGRGEFMEW